jgi:hypothetical protein
MNKVLLLILFFTVSFPGGEWHLKKEKNGIQVYTRSIQGSSFDEFKGVTTIENSSLPEVLAVISDIKNFTSLYPDCINPKILKQEGEHNFIHYSQTKGPLTIKDRDCIMEQKTVIDKGGKHAIISLKPLPGYIPETKNMVRVRNGGGFWELEEDNGSVKVVYQFHGDPGGEIPAWLANSYVEIQPFETLTNLRKRLKK